MSKSRLFNFFTKNATELLVIGTTAAGTYFSSGKYPLDMEDEVKFGERARGVTYGYTATGYPVSLPMEYEKKLALEKKWEKEHLRELELGCKKCNKPGR